MRYLIPILCVSLATPALAQDQEPGLFGRIFGGSGEAEEDGGGFLENLIEENLSGEGRQVRIVGFDGALSGSASLETMTISDADGAWLTLRDVTLDWNRAALLRGRIEVAELSAGSIELPRLPLPAEGEPPAPEASGFSLPELPVSVEIGRLAAERVEIGQPVFGAETIASVEGSFNLAGGEGAAILSIDRLNAEGALSLDAAYSNETRVLALDLSLDEGPDGIVANLIDLPGRPSVAFSVAGEAPLDAYAADIRLATDGRERLTGRIVTERPDTDDGASLGVTAELGGDIAPVFLPAYQTFFGEDVRLATSLTTFEDGRFVLDTLSIEAASLNLAGEMEIGADGLPDRIAFDGTIADTTGQPVLLPLAGPETRVDGVALDVSFDAEAGDRWTGAFEITGLDRDGFSAETLLLDGTGQIRGGAGDASVTANLEIDATRLDLGNPEAEEALGERVTGGADITWATGQPIRLSGLGINGESYSLAGFATLSTSENGFDADGEVSAQASDLSVFSGLAQRTLGGEVSLATTFSAQPLAGFFDVAVSGSTSNLVVSQPEADRILAGDATLEASATRNENGLRFELTTLESPNASIVGQGNLRSDGSTISLSASLADVALVLPQIDGPARLTASTTQDGSAWNWEANAGLEGASLIAEGQARNLLDVPLIEARGTLVAEDLSVFSELAGREIGGAVDMGFAGEVVTDLSRANVSLNGTTIDLVSGIAQADRLMAGAVAVAMDAALADDVISLRNTTIDGENAQLNANGTISAETGRFASSGRITSTSLLLPGAPEGPLDFSVETLREGDNWDFNVDVEGPEIAVTAAGTAIDPTGPLAAIVGRTTIDAGDLSIFSDLANRSLNGNLTLGAEGALAFDLSRFDLVARANGSGLAIGQQQVDQLLAGDLSLDVNARRDGEAIEVETLTFLTRLLSVTAEGSLGQAASAITLDARLADVSPFVAGFSGPARVSGSIGQDGLGADLTPDIVASGPGGARATVRGAVAQDFSNLNIDVDGTAPLGLLNTFIQPRSIAGNAAFDLSVNGPPALESVTGVITTSGTRLVTPTLGITINDINGNVRLQSGTANVSLAMSPEEGGLVSVQGPISLAPPIDSNLAIRLRDVVLTDPRLYETEVNGTVALVGPLQGGARISGDLVLSETTIQIPSSAIGGTGAIPEVIHINEPPPVRGTRRRAGLITASGNGNGTEAGPGFPLDIRISAPNQLFVRGRGLDSEFAGELRVTGTTNDVVPIGAFNLVRGRLDILGQRLAIEEATITLQGSFIPVLRIVASTQSDEYRINVTVSGPAENPEIAFTSEPELPEEEVLSRLLFGRGLDTLSPLQAARLALAVRTLAGQGGEGIVGNIRNRAGLADFDVSSDEDGNTQVRAGAYLSENVYTDVTIGSDGDTRLNLNLDVTRSLTLKGSASNTGDTSVGVFFERDY